MTATPWLRENVEKLQAEMETQAVEAEERSGDGRYYRGKAKAFAEVLFLLEREPVVVVKVEAPKKPERPRSTPKSKPSPVLAKPIEQSYTLSDLIGVVEGEAKALEPFDRVIFRVQGSMEVAQPFYSAKLDTAYPQPIIADSHGRLPMLHFAPSVKVWAHIQ